MRLYKRGIKVVVGQDDGTAVSVENLYIKIEIKKLVSGKPNEGFVQIYNLADQSESQIRDKGTRVRVFAGHDGELPLIYDGDIRRVERDRVGVDRITTIVIGGNVQKLSEAVFNKSYSGQTSVRQIVEDAVPGFGLDVADLDQIPTGKFLYDFSYTGKTATLLDEILNPIGVQWFETDNFIKFSADTTAIERVFLLSQGTGLIGSASVTEKGVKFKAVLNGRLVLNNKIKIESILVNGVYKITQIIHRGDNREGEFVSEGIGIPVE